MPSAGGQAHFPQADELRLQGRGHAGRRLSWGCRKRSLYVPQGAAAAAAAAAVSAIGSNVAASAFVLLRPLLPPWSPRKPISVLARSSDRRPLRGRGGEGRSAPKLRRDSFAEQGRTAERMVAIRSAVERARSVASQSHYAFSGGSWNCLADECCLLSERVQA